MTRSISRLITLLTIVAAVEFLVPAPSAHAQSASANVSASVSQPQPVSAGTNFDYVINVSNEGPDNADNPTLSFPLPSGVLFQSDVVPAGWSCNTIAPGTDGPTVTCTAATLPPGTATFTVTASTAPTASGTFSTTATITSTTPDPDPNDNSFAVDVIIATSSNFRMALAASPNPVNAGANLTWTATVTNLGPSTGFTATFNLPLPAPTTFVLLSAPAGWNCTTPSVGTNGAVNCTLTTPMSPAAAATFTIVSQVSSSLAAGTTLASTATVSSPDDSVPANDFATVSVQSAANADLAVSKTLNPSLALPGGPLHYTIVVTNQGPSDAAAVVMTDILPAPLRFAAISAPAGWSCTTPAIGANGTISCSLASMVANSVATFTLDVTIAPATTGGTAINNTASAASSTPDGNTSNNSGTATTAVSTPPNVTASKSSNGQSHPEGATFSYTIVLSNSGTLAQGDNPGNELTDVLPSSLTLISATASSGTAVANLGTNTVTWNGGIAGGGSVTITISAVVKNGTFGTTISNQATVSYDSDGNGTNDATRLSDDPATTAPSDPTSFVVAGSVPVLSPGILILLAAALAAMALRIVKP